MPGRILNVLGDWIVMTKNSSWLDNCLLNVLLWIPAAVPRPLQECSWLEVGGLTIVQSWIKLYLVEVKGREYVNINKYWYQPGKFRLSFKFFSSGRASKKSVTHHNCTCWESEIAQVQILLISHCFCLGTKAIPIPSVIVNALVKVINL